MPKLAKAILAVVCLIFVPAVAHAQSSITGVVKDTSGAVLPGVTVEAASPELIEKVRSSVTDGTGQYRILDLRPGTYTVTFSLTGFSTVKREGLLLPADFVSTVSVELKVGALEETVIEGVVKEANGRSVEQLAHAENKLVLEFLALRAKAAKTLP